MILINDDMTILIISWFRSCNNYRWLWRSSFHVFSPWTKMCTRWQFWHLPCLANCTLEQLHKWQTSVSAASSPISMSASSSRRLSAKGSSPPSKASATIGVDILKWQVLRKRAALVHKGYGHGYGLWFYDHIESKYSCAGFDAGRKSKRIKIGWYYTVSLWYWLLLDLLVRNPWISDYMISLSLIPIW